MTFTKSTATLRMWGSDGDVLYIHAMINGSLYVHTISYPWESHIVKHMDGRMRRHVRMVLIQRMYEKGMVISSFQPFQFKGESK